MSLRECAPHFSHPLFLGHYIDDIAKCLIEKEQTRKQCNFASPQSDYRGLLVDFMKNFSEYRGFRRTSLHLGVYLLDVFMDNYWIALERLNIVSIVCLCLGAKVEEMESNVPRVSEISKLTNIECTVEDYILFETLILEHFDWDVMQPTAVTFIELYMDAVVSQEDFLVYNTHVTDGIMFKDLKAMKSTATTITFEFLNISLANLRMSLECPSKLAASIVAATRYSISLDPIWTPNMTRITGYQLVTLEDLISQLFRLKNVDTDSPGVTNKQKNTPDSGYMSSKETDTEDENDQKSCTKRFKS